MADMSTKTITDLIRRASSLPEPAQQELEEVITEMEERYGEIYYVTDDERTSIERGLMAMREGRFARPGDVEAIFRKARAQGA
jgi:HSP90 family molecular chaperone